MLTAVLCALGAAVCLATAAALQHHAATGHHSYRTGVHLLARLFRDPVWVVGFVVSAAGLGLHAAALHFGPLAVVQPLLVTNLVFALPLRALLDRVTPSGAEVVAAGIVVAALTGFLLAAHPTRGHANAETAESAVVLGIGIVVVIACSATASRTHRGRIAGLTLGLATGVLYGLVGGSLKATVHLAASGPRTLLTHWPLWVLLATGAWALVVNQRAYTHAPLPVSLPVLTVTNPIVAVIFGAYVFNEKPADTPGRVVLQAIFLVLLAAGVTALATRTPTHQHPASGD
ncbi:MAG: DMT family transporter [Mycobacteriales bacterium]